MDDPKPEDKTRVPPRPFVLPGPLLGLLTILVLFILLLAWKGQLRNFLSLNNLQVVFHKNTIPAVAALGMLIIMISGGIDLSVGSVAALVTVVTMQVYCDLESRTGSMTWASLAAVASGLVVGGLCGLLNGLAITRLRVSPFVATLGMLSMARGLAYWLSGRSRIGFPGGVTPGWVEALARAKVDNFTLFDPGFWSMVLLALAVAFLLRATVFGRYCYAIGSSEATARLCGIHVERMKLAIYSLAGLITGWTGVLVFAQTTSGDPTGSVGLELDVIAAVVIGGASLSGGQGGVTGTLLGVLILAVVENGVSLFDVTIEVKYILIGAIVILNTALSRWQRAGSE